MSNSIGSYSVPHQPAVEAELVMRHHNGDVTKVEFPGGVSASIDYGVDYQDVHGFSATHRLKTSEQYTMTLNILRNREDGGPGNVMVFHKGGKWMNKKALRKIAKRYLEAQTAALQNATNDHSFDMVEELENLGYDGTYRNFLSTKEKLKEYDRYNKALRYVWDLIENAAVTVTVTETKKEEKKRLKREAKKESTADLVSEW